MEERSTRVSGTLAAWLLALPFTLAASASLLLLTPFPGRRRRGDAMIRWWARNVLRIAGIPHRMTGEENLPEEDDAPCVFVSNHTSMLDIPVCLAHLPGHVRLLAKRSLFRIPVFGWLLRMEGFVPVDRSSQRRARRSLRPASERIGGGTRVFVFPEGTRSRTGEPGPFKTGAFRLAIQAGVPVVPLAMVGAGEVLRPKSMRVKEGEVTLVVGPPIETGGLGEEDRHEVRRRAETWIRGALGRQGSPSS
ncbi:MAG: lysophospholipid acyltransferase family protein [bacterium]